MQTVVTLISEHRSLGDLAELGQWLVVVGAVEDARVTVAGDNVELVLRPIERTLSYEYYMKALVGLLKLCGVETIEVQ